MSASHDEQPLAAPGKTAEPQSTDNPLATDVQPHDITNVSAIEPEISPSDVDTDSSYGEEIASYSTSVRSSIYDHPERFGRKYHAYKEGRYVLPADEEEMDRLDIHHHLILRAMQNHLYYAPLPKDFAGRVLDICTGTGIWAIDFADAFPSSFVIGNDLAAMQPQLIPPNVQFFIDDVESEWTYPPRDAFDYIHGRFLVAAIADWPKLMKNAYDHAKPGAYVEFSDWDTYLYSQDGTLPPDSALKRFHIMSCDGRSAQGFDMKPGPKLEGWMKDAGFVDLKVSKIPLPLGPWPKDKFLKEVGVINLVQMEAAVEGICLGVLTQLPPEAGGPWTYEEVQVFLSEIRNDMRDKKIHSLYDFWVVHGRKPSN